nr:sigma-54-dependent Fis family transcriptional regulator [uncultured Rhodopila sp.]
MAARHSSLKRTGIKLGTWQANCRGNDYMPLKENKSRFQEDSHSWARDRLPWELDGLVHPAPPGPDASLIVVDRPAAAWDWMKQTGQAPVGTEWVRACVAEAWCRCLDEYDLKLTRPLPMLRGNGVPLAAPQPNAADLADAARECLTFSMYRLAHITGESDVTLLLTDAAGTLIHVLDAGVRRCPAGAHLAQLGVSWSERNLGNTGIGTALKLCEPIAFDGKEHFFEGLHPFATAGCPILGWDGRLIGGLGAMTDHRDSAKALLGLLRLATCLLEQDLLERCAPGDVLLRLRADKLDDDLGLEEGLVNGLMSVRSDGTIDGLNRIAVLLLACEDSLAITGRPLKAVLGLELADLYPKSVSDGVGARLRLASGRWLIVDPVLRRTNASQRTGGSGARVVERYQVQAAKMPPACYDEKPEGVRDVILAPLLRKAVGLQAQKISILITGESGTGKEHFVRQLRELGPRKNKPFVAINCGAMPRELIESELFGYVGGSFTGASSKGKAGKFLEADGGILLLDEIGEMALDLQVALLRVLESSEVTPVGGTQPIPLDVHVVAATNRRLADSIQSGTFRRDLYYRLNGAQILLPPLRERPDKARLIAHLLRIEQGEMKIAEPKELSPQVWQLFMQHPWPGNIRELRNVLRASIAMTSGPVVGVADLPQDFVDETERPAWDADERCDTRGATAEQGLLVDWEERAVRAAIDLSGGNITTAARRLNITRATLYKKMARYGLSRGPVRSAK